MELKVYSGEWMEVEVLATPMEYAAMAERIAALVGVGAGEVMFPAIGAELSELAVSISSGPVAVSIRGQMLTVCGNPEVVDLFGQNLPSEQNLPGRYHVHYEHSTRPEHVAADSIPLILRVGGSQNNNQPLQSTEVAIRRTVALGDGA